MSNSLPRSAGRNLFVRSRMCLPDSSPRPCGERRGEGSCFFFVLQHSNLFARILLVFLCATAFANAQEKPLVVESSTIQPSVALGRPMLTWWDVKIPGSGLVVGKFRFSIKSEGYQFASLETEELTLNGPEQRIRIMLPAIDCPQMIDQLQVDISFDGKKYSGNLGQQILRVPFATKTVFIGLVGESRTVRKRSPQRDKILERLKFETIIPEVPNVRGDANDPEYVKTIFASIDPVDFPADPLSYCGYDIVVLMKDEFRSLRKLQLDGLLAWIKAGGSLYLEPNGVLEGYHVDFLRSVTANDASQLIIQLDEAGKLPVDTVPVDQVAMAIKCGLGDVVMKTADPDRDDDESSKSWLAVTKPLWKSRFETNMRSANVIMMANNANGQPVQVQRPSPDPFGFSMAMYNRVTLRPTELLDRLMPDGVRMVPLSLLSAILLGFVVLIGPGDYFGLGWLRARKLTWITFPLATLGVTALTVWLSNLYMTGAETRRALVLRDVGDNGEIVRTNRFELLFVASTKQVPTAVEKGVFAKLDTGSTMDRMNAAAMMVGTMNGSYTIRSNGQIITMPPMSVGVGAGNGRIHSVTTQFDGRIPTQFTAMQDLAKWTPQINRIMSIPGSGTTPEVDWKEFELASIDAQTIRQQHNVSPHLIARAKERFGQGAMVACFTGSDGWAYDRSAGWRSTRNMSHDSRITFTNTFNPNGNSNFANNSPMWEPDLFRWLHQASVSLFDQGVFALAKHTTPKGGAVCDDLTLLDTSDPMAWMLVIVVPEKDDFVVYRKLMRFKD